MDNKLLTTNNKSQKGTTFIELILYMAIVTIMLSAIIPFSMNVIEGSAKSTTQQEVYYAARIISERIKYEIRNAAGINTVAATSISLATSTPATNPTVINLSSGNIRITQGAGSPINLNPTGITISSLAFTNYTSLDNRTKNIQFSLTVATNATTTRQEFNETVNIRGDAEVRSN